MTIFTFANNINTTLAGAVSPSATTITLASTANLPATIPAGEVLVVTLNDAATRQNFEIVYATARTGATLTVLRAQEGTAALSWLTGDFAYSPPTAGQQESFGQLAAANTWTGANTFSDPVTVGTATTSGEAVNLGQAQSTFAALAGLATQVFSAAPAVSPNEVVSLGQFTNGSNSSGSWFKFPSGWMLQVMSVTIPLIGVTVTFPEPFTTSVTGLVAMVNANTGATLTNNGPVGGEPISLAQANFFTAQGAPSVTIFAWGI